MSSKKEKSKTKKAETVAPEISAELVPAEEKDYSNLPVNEQAAFRCKDRIENAVKDATKAFYDMTMGLLEAYENDYAKIWGYENFSAYVEGVLDMKYRSAYYMVEIGKVVRKFDLDRDRVTNIGWTKMREIASFINDKPDEAARYLEMAENMSAVKLKEALSSEVRMIEGREATLAIMRLSMKLEGDAANIVNDALAMAYADIGKEDASLAMQHVAGEWLVARGATPQGATLEDWIAYLERQYGVRLVRAEEADSLDALLTGTDVSTEADDRALEELLDSTENELSGLTQ